MSFSLLLVFVWLLLSIYYGAKILILIDNSKKQLSHILYLMYQLCDMLHKKSQDFWVDTLFFVPLRHTIVKRVKITTNYKRL